MGYTDTIAAIATPPGKGGVAIIRISGRDALALARRVFVPHAGEFEPLPRRACYGTVRDGETVLDDVLLTYFKAPRSYTGEETVEIACHGGVYLQTRVLEAVLRAGARCAAPGEFTRRAYLSGKLGLADVEAIGALIEAENDEQMRLASLTSRTALARACDALRVGMVDLLASLFAEIDFPDEDIETDPETVRNTLAELRGEVARLLDGYRTGRAIRDGIRTALLGLPNVGKSSLYNRLLGRDAAIVTDIPGTTRDTLTARTPLGRVMLELADTAGIRESSDPIEAIGVARSRAEGEEAELLLLVLDLSRPLGDAEHALMDQVLAMGGTPVVLANKADLPHAWELSNLPPCFPHALAVSAETGAGLEGLTPLVEGLFTDGSLVSGVSAIVATARQASGLSDAMAHLDAATAALGAGMPADAVASSIERAATSLAEINGTTLSHDVVDAIFSHFCVGK